MQTTVSLADVQRVVRGTHDDPSTVLGPHPIRYNGRDATAIRGFFPESSSVWLIDHVVGNRRAMRKIHPAGFFEIICEWSSSTLLRRL